MLKNLLPEALQESVPLLGEDIILTGRPANSEWNPDRTPNPNSQAGPATSSGTLTLPLP